MKSRWKRTATGDYYLLVGENVRATVRRKGVPRNSHFALWVANDASQSFPTLRDAKVFCEKRLGVGEGETP